MQRCILPYAVSALPLRADILAQYVLFPRASS